MLTAALPPLPTPSAVRAITSPLLTPNEALFHACLENLTQYACHIQAKPRLAEVLQHEDLIGFQRICHRHIDFLVYRRQDWMPMIAIEFEDSSAEKAARKDRDRNLAIEVLSAAGIPILRVHSREIQQMETLMHKFSAAWQHRLEILASTSTPQDSYFPLEDRSTVPLNASAARCAAA
ncbi:MAG: DUF2726 domain-containing protein [Prosthecobacter sp.]|jgi:hypothetical protein|uniref:DUF2726 domain-containing protein n=1 Tax=Prosthecobacter sp. TaxID=1965333 RepID=UPI0019E7209A|nr:DUF2726 domain-containing protein [Prosthecobacter sp.]MBE2283260.1 DUF2726 domain-containing protein [Prosthecobacter sp.]